MKSLILALCAFLGAQTLAADKPNILFILADDLGFGDLSISGNPVLKTLNIDALARRSVRCNSGYSAAPVCMPSRISIQTGKYDYRTGARMSVASRMPDLNQPWLAAALKGGWL